MSQDIHLDRRSVLSVVAGSFVIATAGCTRGNEQGSQVVDNHIPPAEDKFPDDVDSGTRGGADTVAVRTIETEDDYSDTSVQCAKAVDEIVWEQIKSRIETTKHVGHGYGQGPSGWEGIAVYVCLTVAKYNRDGEVIDKADLDYDTLVSNTPPTAYVVTDESTRVCAVPVYVRKIEVYVD